MKLTGCVITKNEEINIERCLNSLKSIVSEIIVVDTGSKDRTVQLAEDLGASVYHFEWVNDFSKAKNYAISKAKGNWIIFLDADEYLEQNSIIQIKECILRAEKAGFDGVLSTLINFDIETNSIQSSMPKTRIFKNDGNIHFYGAIHEKIKHTNRQLKLLDFRNKITIIHLGYSNREVQRKQKGYRNLSMLLEEFKNEPNNHDINFYVSEAYGSVKEYELALFYAIRAHIGNNSRLLGAKEKNSMNIIRYMHQLEYSHADIVRVLKEVVNLFPTYPDFYVYYGDYYKKNKYLEDAILMYEMAISLINNEEASLAESSLSSALLTIYKVLSNLYNETNKFTKAVHTLSVILKTDRYDFASLNKLLKLLLKNGEDELQIINFFEKIYNTDETKDLIFLLKAALHNGSYTLANYYFTCLHSSSINLEEEKLELLFLKGDYVTASNKYIQLFEEKQDNRPFLIKAIAASLITPDEKTKNEVFQIARNVSGIDLKNILNKQGNQHYSQEELEVLLDIIKELRRLSKYEEIENIINKSENDQILLATAELLYQWKKFDLALLYFDQYLQRNQEIEETLLVDILCKLSNCLYENGEYEIAEKYIEHAYSFSQNEYLVYSLWVKIATCLKNSNRVKEVAQKAIDVFPDSRYFASILDSLGIVIPIENNGNKEDIVKTILYSEKFLQNLYKRAMELTKEGKDREAAPIYEFLTDIDMFSSKAHLQLEKITRLNHSKLMNHKLLLEKEFKNRIERISQAKKQRLMFKMEKSKERIHIVYVMAHVGICGGVKIILEHANRLKKVGMEVTIVSHYPVPTWYPVEVNYIEVPFDVELATGIPNCDVIVATYWDHIQACIDTAIAPVIYFEQGDFHLFEKEYQLLNHTTLNSQIKDFIFKQYQLPEFIVTVSHQTARIIKEKFNREAKVIHNAIDRSIFKDRKSDKNKVSDSYILMMGSDQTVFKGISDIIAAHAIIKKERKDLKLYWITPNPPSKEYAKFVDQVFISPTQQEIAELFRGASLYVSASHYESFSLPVLEAMACGCPVVTAGNSGVLEYAKDNFNVLLTKIGDSQDISNKILKVLRNPKLKAKLISNGLSTAKNFDWENTTSNLLKLYREVASYEVIKTSATPVLTKGNANMYGVYIGDNKMLIKTIWGGKLFASNKDMSLMPDLVANGVIEAPLTRYFIKNVKEGNTIIDVGANIGYFTILTGHKVGNNGKVIAFEANENTFSFLIDNVSINYLTERVKLYNKAVYSQEKEISLFTTERFSGNASIHQPNQEYYDYFLVDKGMEEKKVEAITLDQFVGKDELVNYVKIDIEGGEYHCLLGMEDLIKSKRVETVIFELNKLRSKSDSEKLYNLLRKFQDEYEVKYAIIDTEGIENEYPLDMIFNYDFIPAVVMNVR